MVVNELKPAGARQQRLVSVCAFSMMMAEMVVVVTGMSHWLVGTSSERSATVTLLLLHVES